MSDPLAPADARAWIARVPALGGLPTPALDRLGEGAVFESFPAGAVVVREGDAADALYVVAEGVAEIRVARGDTQVPMGRLGPAELFGEIALLEPDARRRATVAAATDLRLVKVDAAPFRELLRQHPELETAFREAARLMLLQGFIKLATPFESLPPERARWLAERVSGRRVEAGERIVEQGTPGEACYLVRRGRVEVLFREQPDAPERALATLEAGALFGEAALVTEGPRNASVRALEAGELLVLSRSDLLAAAEAGDLRSRLRDLVRWRDRPERRPGIEEHARDASDGAALVVLKDPQRAAYYQLSPEGHFIWRRLDGRTTLRELTMLYLREFRRLDPQAALDVVSALARAGFVTSPRVGALEERASPSAAWLTRLAGLVDLRWTFHGLDRATGRLHRLLGWAFAPPAVAVQAGLAVVGIAAFAWSAGSHGDVLAALARVPVLLWVYLGALASTLLHELAHALVVKRYGREVRSAGLGLYYLTPMAFVDTSDMWLEPRRRRIWVNAVGMAVNMAVGGAAALAALAVDAPGLRLVLWLLAAVNYLAVLTNLNPLLELDGYYMLSDALDRPNLRQESLAWLGQRAWADLRSGRAWRTRRVELLYGLAAVAYATVLTVTTVMMYRGWVLQPLARVVPGWTAELVGVVMAAGVVAVLVAGVYQDLRGPVRS